MARIVVLAERNLTPMRGKTAVGLIRYREPEIVGSIDSTRSGMDVATALGQDVGHGIPVFRDVPESLTARPDTLAIGVSPASDQLKPDFRAQILLAIESGLDILSGLHFRLSQDPEIATAARRHGVRLHDLRTPPEDRRVAAHVERRQGNSTVLAVGSDGTVGKMTTMLELDRAARQAGLSSTFLATGQTGMMIAGGGLPADGIVSDFLAGAVQEHVVELAERFDWTFVEGQGALNHPAYAAVTVGIMHGALPDAMIMCHAAGATSIEERPDCRLPDLPRLIAANEEMVNLVRPDGDCAVVGVSLRTLGMSDRDAAAAVRQVTEETGLPTTDVIRFGPEPLLAALLAHRDNRRGDR
ncbi:DUF1611 domain-containing protein [Amycolatopsis nigrescens]|uniref:DUF1611 domain-containing protein n=1 Tax=Amycolatopsis nigrescens TaxID=381445 RepID=UPI000375D017|nr:DUF1611 domain-containing protein [Amycolatopsis nigrescens]